MSRLHGIDDTPAPRGRKIGAGKKKDSKRKEASKKAPGKAKKTPGQTRPVPEFPTSSGGCS